MVPCVSHGFLDPSYLDNTFLMCHLNKAHQTLKQQCCQIHKEHIYLIQNHKWVGWASHWQSRRLCQQFRNQGYLE